MVYKELIEHLRGLQTRQVRALSFLHSCAVTQIPNAFTILLSNIVEFLHTHVNHFCHLNEVMGVFGLQVVACSIQSDLPKQLNRIRYPSYPRDHFCCSLNYLTAPHDKIGTIDSWKNYKSLVIDFTTGKIMSPAHYLHLLECNGKPDTVYGELNSELLNSAWRLADKELL